jgi:hypothetical protein
LFELISCSISLNFTTKFNEHHTHPFPSPITFLARATSHPRRECE